MLDVVSNSSNRYIESITNYNRLIDCIDLIGCRFAIKNLFDMIITNSEIIRYFNSYRESENSLYLLPKSDDNISLKSYCLRLYFESKTVGDPFFANDSIIFAEGIIARGFYADEEILKKFYSISEKIFKSATGIFSARYLELMENPFLKNISYGGIDFDEYGELEKHVVLIINSTCDLAEPNLLYNKENCSGCPKNPLTQKRRRN